MKRLLLLLLTFTTLNCFSQTAGNYKIEITAKASASQSEYKIHVLKEVDRAKIIYLKRNQEDLKPTKQDSLEILELAKSFTHDLEAKKRLTQIFEKYKSYDKDSLAIPLNHPLMNVCDTLSVSKQKEPQENENDKRRVVLDGTVMKIKVLHEDGPEYEFYVVSPRKDTHPLVYQLITDALELYRDSAEDPILTKNDTHGY